MQEEKLRSVERSVRDLVSFVRTGLGIMFLVNALAFAGLVYGLLKIGEFWAVDSRNIWLAIKELEKHHGD